MLRVGLLVIVLGACGSRTGLSPADGESAGVIDGGAEFGGRGGVAGAGGVGTAGVSGARAGSAGFGAAGPACTAIAIADPLVNDFENGNVKFTSPSGIPQNWYSSTIVGEEWKLGFEPPKPPRPSSSSMLAIKLEGFGSSAAIGVLFQGCFSIAPARAIRFYIYATSTAVPLVVRADTRATSRVASGGACDQCSANIATVPLGSGWQEVEIPFDRFAGGSFPFEASDQLGFSFQWSTGDRVAIPYELWIDDVTYTF